MLQDLSCPIGGNLMLQITPEFVPPPPCEMPSPPPGFEVPSAGFNVEPSGGSMLTGGTGHSNDWVPLSSSAPQPGPQLQPHFPPPRSSMPATGPSPPVTWGMGSLPGAGAPGTWAPLSTNPSSMTGSWLSTGVQDCEGSAVAVSSATMTHSVPGCSSASSAHVPYSMPPPTNTNQFSHGLWSASGALAGACGMVSTSMAPMLPAVGLSLATPQWMQANRPDRNQLRAEAAPYVPMNVGVGIPAY